MLCNRKWGKRKAVDSGRRWKGIGKRLRVALQGPAASLNAKFKRSFEKKGEKGTNFNTKEGLKKRGKPGRTQACWNLEKKNERRVGRNRAIDNEGNTRPAGSKEKPT